MCNSNRILCGYRKPLALESQTSPAASQLRRSARMIAVAAAVLLSISPALGYQATDQGDRESEIEQMRKAMAEQAESAAALSRRLAELEKSQAAILEQLNASKSQSGSNSTGGVNPELLAEIQDQIDQIHEDIDSMPVVSGYLDVEYFNDDKGDSPGEFRAHHLSLHISQEFDSLR